MNSNISRWGNVLVCRHVRRFRLCWRLFINQANSAVPETGSGEIEFPVSGSSDTSIPVRLFICFYFRCKLMTDIPWQDTAKKAIDRAGKKSKLAFVDFYKDG